MESQVRYNLEAGSASHPLGTLRGSVGASAGMEHPCSSTPLLCLHPFPASAPTSLCAASHALGSPSLRLWWEDVPAAIH